MTKFEDRVRRILFGSFVAVILVLFWQERVVDNPLVRWMHQRSERLDYQW